MPLPPRERTRALPLPLLAYVQGGPAAGQEAAGDSVTYYVEVITPVGHRTDFITSSPHQARERRNELQGRGYLAQVLKGSRLFIDALGDERQ